MRQTSTVMLAQSDQAICMHIEGSESAGRMKAFLDETADRMNNQKMLIGEQSITALKLQAVNTFYQTLAQVVNEYYDHLQTDEQGRAYTKPYNDDHHSFGNRYYEVEDDFSCHHVDGVIFTDKEQTHYEKLTRFYANTKNQSKIA